MIKRILFWMITAVALATGAGVAVVAAAFALYALLKDYLGQPGAAAAVAAVAALLVIGIGLVFGLKAREKAAPAPSLSERLLDVARERPLVAAGAALAAGIVALKNPQAVAALVSAFFAGKAADKAERRRR